jgi:predicted dehydrogenase
MGKDRKRSAVLVGCGSISGAWLRTSTIKERINMVGFVDLRESAAKEKREQYGPADARVGTELAAVLKTCRPEVVFDCTVPEAHCATTLTALQHGCHVLGEKPMADTMANARRMLAAAKKAGRVYGVMQNRRYLPQIRALKRFLDSGALGKVHTVYSDFFIGAHFGGFRDEMKHVLLLDMAIHTFDAARFVTGADATNVYCHEWNPVSSWFAHGASADAIFEMTDGVTYAYRGSWCAEGCGTKWECSWRIIGEKGSLLWDGGDSFRCEVVAKREGFVYPVEKQEVPLHVPKSFKQGHDGCIEAFLNALDRGAEPETVCTDNIHSLAMVHGAVRSGESGRKIPIAK